MSQTSLSPGPSESMSIYDKTCQLCDLHRTCRTVCVPARSTEGADILLIGEAPGEAEDRMGKVFIGQAGAKLAELAHHAGLDLGLCTITNAVKCRPPKNRTPLISEIRACRKYLEAEAAAFTPELVICLGLVAVKAVTGKGDTKLGDVLGTVIPQDMFKCPVYATYHPAAVLRFPHLAQDWIAHVTRALLGATPTAHPTDVRVDYMPKRHARPDFMAVDIETYPGLDPFHPDARIRMVGYSAVPGTAYVETKWPAPPQLIGIDDGPTWHCGSNIKFDLKWLALHRQIPIAQIGPYWDTAIAERLLYPQSTERGLKALAMKYAPEMGNYAAAITPLKAHWEDVRDEDIVEYCGNDADAALRVALAQYAQMRPEDLRIMRFMSDMIVHFAKVEMRGVRVDMEYNAALAYSMSTAVEAEKALLGQAMGFINPQSNPALAAYFGIPSCDEKHLKALGQKDKRHRPVISRLLAYRKMAKLLSTYVLGVSKRVRDGILHTTYRLDGTETGRASCAEPNLQNVARKPEIKRQFIPHHGYWWEGDYSQAELRWGAQMSGDKRMAALLEQDFHTDMAKVVFHTQSPTDEQRTVAKTTTFRIMYGGGAEGLAGALKVSIWDAQRLIQSWYRAVPDFADWQGAQIMEAKHRGYVHTAFGRRYTFPEGLDWDSPLGAHYKRVAVNAPIQGTVGQLCMMAQLALDKSGLYVLLQVHDSVDGDAVDDVPDVLALVKHKMETVDVAEWGIKLTVPLKADVKHGPTWGDLKKWDGLTGAA